MSYTQMDNNGLKGFSWNMVETVLLDMDGTILDKYFDDYFWEHLLPGEYARKYDLDIDTAKSRLLARYKKEEGKLTWTDLDFWSKEFDIDIPALKEQVHHLISVHPDTEDFLQFLQGENKKISLVTNAHYKTVDIKLKKTAIGRYFDSIVSAFDIGMPKEDNAFWEKAAGVIGFDKETTLFIDDTEDVLTSARDYGMRYLLLKAKPSSRGDIKSSEHFSSIIHFRELFTTST